MCSKERMQSENLNAGVQVYAGDGMTIERSIVIDGRGQKVAKTLRWRGAVALLRQELRHLAFQVSPRILVRHQSLPVDQPHARQSIDLPVLTDLRVVIEILRPCDSPRFDKPEEDLLILVARDTDDLKPFVVKLVVGR